MPTLTSIVFCLVCIHFFGGGLVTEALVGSAIILNLTAAVKLYNNSKKKHIVDLKILITFLLLLISISHFFLPLINYFSSTATSYYISQNILMEGAQLGLFKTPEFNFRNSLNYINSLKILLIILNLAPLCYLTATLSTKHKIYLAYSICLIACINVFAALYQNNIRDTGGYIWWVWSSSANKSLGSFVNPNHFGAFCAALIAVPVSRFFSAFREKIYKSLPLYIMFAIILITGVMISRSMGAYLLGGISLCASYFFSSQKLSNGPIKTFSIITAVLIFSALTPIQVEGEIYERGINDSQRKNLYAQIPQILVDFPQGIGPGSFRDISPAYTGSVSQNVVYHHSENTYLQFLVEMGPLFCLLLLVLNIFFINKAISNIRKNKINKSLSSLAACGILISMSHACYDYGFHIPAYSFNIAIFYGFLLSKGSHFDKRRHSYNLYKISKTIYLLPLLAAIFISIQYYHFADKLQYKNQTRHEVHKTIDLTVEELIYRPLAAENWYTIGTEALNKYDDFIYLDYAEKCFRMAAHSLPVSKLNWYTLFAIRDQLGRDTQAKDAYLFYFKLLSKDERIKHKSEAMEVLNLNEQGFEKIKYLEHNPMDFNSNYFKKI